MHEASEGVEALPASLSVPRPCPSRVGRVAMMIGGRELSLEVGKIGPLADAVVYARFGATSVLASAVSSWSPSASGSFLPLQVDYVEKAFAAGQIPTTFTRRESSSSDRELLAARAIDRSLRPLFDKGYFYDTQIICSVMSFDRDCDPGMLAILAASAALHVSNIPFNGPVAAVRVGLLATGEGGGARPLLAPLADEDAVSSLDLLFSATEDRALMMELAGDEVPEASLIRCLRFAHDSVQPLLALQHELRAQCGRPKKTVPLFLPPPELEAAVRALIYDDARALYGQHHFKKPERGNAQRLLHVKVNDALGSTLQPEQRKFLGAAVDTVIKSALRDLVSDAAVAQPTSYVHPMRGAPPPPTPHLHRGDSAIVDREAIGAPLLPPPADSTASVVDDSAEEAPNLTLLDADGARPDGRSTRDIRAISTEIDVLPVVHGSAVFSRGDTQVLCTATLGPLDLAQTLRPTGGVVRKQFFLHYDFPPYCTNETGKVGGANRRMVGHGALAERALQAVVPSDAVFPYTVRVTSEVTGSDGSSSMATVCGASLALMDAGVPIKEPVAGISIGAVCTDTESFKRGSRYALLTDIFGLEDHSGDMDFKVAGTRYGITAVQLDIKPAGLPLEVLEQALWRARDARLLVLDAMAAVIATPRPEVKDSAPLVEQMHVPVDLIGRLLGQGGSAIRRIQAVTGAHVQVSTPDEASGGGSLPVVSVYAPRAQMASAKDLIRTAFDEHGRMTGAIMSPVTSLNGPSLTVGTPATVVVSKLMDFGALLSIGEHEVGFLHVSEMDTKRTHRIVDLMGEGDELTVQVVDIDSRGRAKFSLRTLLQPGESPSKYIKRLQPKMSETAAISSAAVEASSKASSHSSLDASAAAARMQHDSAVDPATSVTAATVPERAISSSVATVVRRGVDAAAPVSSPAPSSALLTSHAQASFVHNSDARSNKTPSPPEEAAKSESSKSDFSHSQADREPRSTGATDSAISDSRLSQPAGQVFWPAMFAYLLPGVKQARALHSAKSLPPYRTSVASPSWLRLIGVSADGKVFQPQRSPDNVKAPDSSSRLVRRSNKKPASASHSSTRLSSPPVPQSRLASVRKEDRPNEGLSSQNPGATGKDELASWVQALVNKTSLGAEGVSGTDASGSSLPLA